MISTNTQIPFCCARRIGIALSHVLLRLTISHLVRCMSTLRDFQIGTPSPHLLGIEISYVFRVDITIRCFSPLPCAISSTIPLIPRPFPASQDMRRLDSVHLPYVFRRAVAQMGGLFSDLLPLALTRYLMSQSCDEGLPRLAEFGCRGPRGRWLLRIWPSTAG